MSTKNIILLIVGIAAAIVLFLFGRSCDISSVLKTTGTKKIVTHDSISVKLFPFPVPYRVDSMVFVKGGDGKPYPVYDTLWGTQEIIQPADTQAILARYYETAYYHHEVDTGRWKITVDESVTQNRLKNWSLKAVSSDITTTNTVQLKPPKNFVMYFALSASGNRYEPLGGAGVGLAAKLPNDKVFILQYKATRFNQPMIEATYLAPIQLGKRIRE